MVEIPWQMPKNPIIKEAFTSRLGFERISCNDTLRISVSEIYEFTGGKHFKFMKITELSTAKLTDTLRS